MLSATQIGIGSSCLAEILNGQPLKQHWSHYQFDTAGQCRVDTVIILVQGHQSLGLRLWRFTPDPKILLLSVYNQPRLKKRSIYNCSNLIPCISLVFAFKPNCTNTGLDSVYFR